MATHSSSSDQQESPPSFFKVIRYPSATHLSLPNAFVRRYMEQIPKNPTLVTASGDHSWSVQFVKIGEDYCFAHGWDALVKDVGLCSRDVVVFWLIDSLTFLVTFLGANGCEKYVPLNKTNDNNNVVKDDDDVVVVGECNDVVVKTKENLCFQKVFTKTSRTHMFLPIKFVRVAGLKHKDIIWLKDHEGKVWRMGILLERYTSTKYSLSAGWARFFRYHNFSEGDVCTFAFNRQEGVLSLTQLCKTKTPIKQDFPNGNVKIDDECWPNEKPRNSWKVKTEYESGSEMEVVKRKQGGSPLKGYANVKIEDGWVPEKTGSGGGVEVNTERGTEGAFRSEHVIYF